MSEKESAVGNILVLNSSVQGDGSVSRQLVEETVDRLLKSSPHSKVVRRDLGAAPIPHLSTATLAGVRGVPSNGVEHATRALSDELIAELRAAETIVIGAPMYNFSIPTGLRAWFDYVLRAGETFSYSAAGPQGLLTGKGAIVIASRGGLYSEGPARAMDYQEPYLRQLLSFMGISNVTFVLAEKIAFGAEARESAISEAKARIGEVTLRRPSPLSDVASG